MVRNICVCFVRNIRRLKPSADYKLYYILPRMRECGLNATVRTRRTKSTWALLSTTQTKDSPRTTTLTGIRKVMSVLRCLLSLQILKVRIFYFLFSSSTFLIILEGVMIAIECKAWAENIEHDRTERRGIAHFEVITLLCYSDIIYIFS